MGEGKLRSALGLAYAGLGQKDDAVREGRLAAELHSYERDALADWRLHDLARIYAMTDEPQLAIEQLEFLMSVPSWMSPALARLDPTFVSLRDEPRYRELVER